jgi:putative transposase
MTLFLDELSGHVAPGTHAILVLDGAGWHTAKDLRWPDQVTPLPLPAYSPELHPQERVWAFLRQHHLALRRFLDHTALLDVCQDAWRRFIGAPGRLRSLCSYPWATVS